MIAYHALHSILDLQETNCFVLEACFIDFVHDTGPIGDNEPFMGKNTCLLIFYMLTVQLPHPAFLLLKALRSFRVRSNDFNTCAGEIEYIYKV